MAQRARDILDGFLGFFSANRDIRRSDFPDFYKTMPDELFNVREIEAPGVIYKDDHVEVEAIENCHFHFPNYGPSYVTGPIEESVRFGCESAFPKWRTRHDSNVWPLPSEGNALSS